jgi:N utilization substance protein A
MSRDFVGALLQLNAEKGVSREQLVATVEEAIQSAYRRVAPGNENVGVEIDPDTGRIRVYRAKTVVEEVEDPTIQFTVDEAKGYKQDAKLGDLVEIEQVDPGTFGRIHAQTAKQVVLQRLREAEREVVFGQYAQREGEIITGTVNRVEPRAIILDVGRAVEAILATTEQSATEHYRIGQHVKAYVLEVRRTTKGPQIFVSRTHKGFLRRLFELEVPEIHSGLVEIRAIAREPGSRSKVAVASRQEGLDPVGATVGQRGGRVQAVVAELGGEKIDVIPWSDDPAQMVANALSPAQVVKVTIDEENRIANVVVPERMLSLAIGREGQNARLAAKLTGWRIDIRSDLAPPPVPGEAPPPRRTPVRPPQPASIGSSQAAAAQSGAATQPGAAQAATQPGAAQGAAGEAPATAETAEVAAGAPEAPVDEARSGPAAQPETEQLAAPAEPAPRKTARARRVPAAGATEAPVEEVVGVATEGDGIVTAMPDGTEAAPAKPARKASASKTTAKSASKTTAKSAAPKAKSAAPKAAAKPAKATRTKKAAVAPAEEPTPEGVAS